MKLAQYLSVKNKLISGDGDVKYLGEDNEWLIQYCKRKVLEKPYNFMVFGHRHLPLDIDLGDGSRYINLGDWINHYTYAVWDSNGLKLEKYKIDQELAK